MLKNLDECIIREEQETQIKKKIKKLEIVRNKHSIRCSRNRDFILRARKTKLKFNIPLLVRRTSREEIPRNSHQSK